MALQLTNNMFQSRKSNIQELSPIIGGNSFVV